MNEEIQQLTNIMSSSVVLYRLLLMYAELP